jgi:quaternary ammonium compound-resistance protein SugE
VAWLILILAGLFEAAFTFCLGKAKMLAGTPATGWWYAGFLAALTISMLLLMRAIRELPIGTAYAVWTGIGAVGTALVGILVFREPATFWRLFFMTTLIASVVGLKVFSH